MGGLIGANHGSLTASHNKITSTIVGRSAYVGGLLGMNTSPSTLTSMTSKTIISGFSQVGGVIGQNNGSLTGSIIKTDSKILITGTNDFGGFAGANTNNGFNFSQVQLTTSIGQDPLVTYVESVGGVIGRNHGNSSFTSGSIFADITLEAGSDVKGVAMFIGYNTNETHLLGFTFTGLASTTGAVNCDAVAPTFGVQHSETSTIAQSSLNLDFSQFECL